LIESRSVDATSVRAIVKSYFLEGLIDEQSARIELSKALPNQWSRGC